MPTSIFTVFVTVLLLAESVGVNVTLRFWSVPAFSFALMAGVYSNVPAVVEAAFNCVAESNVPNVIPAGFAQSTTGSAFSTLTLMRTLVVTTLKLAVSVGVNRALSSWFVPASSRVPMVGV